LKQKKSRAQALDAAFDRFYKGDIAQEFDRFFKENHGVMTAADLAAYRPEWQEPVHVTYRGYDVYSNPATSRGGIELAMQLNLAEGFNLAKMGASSPEALHVLIEAIKLAKADVYRYVADPKFTQVPMAGLLSKSYAESRRALIQPRKAMVYPAAGEPARFGGPATAAGVAAPRPAKGSRFDDHYETERDTTSFSIIDQYGNAVSCTPTLGGGFGAGVVVGNTGLLLNNGDRLGSSSPYPDNVNYVRGGQIPLLNNSPTIVLKDGRVAMVFGTPGGETIGQTEFQMLVNVIDFHMPVQQAVEHPRFVLDAKPNFYKPGSEISVTIERRVPPAALKALEEWGHKLAPTSDFTAAAGGMQAIVVDLAKGTMLAGADPRRTGYAVGW
jgi:gamma-glutamyltranspeptidase/glutathione hydrolase